MAKVKVDATKKAKTAAKATKAISTKSATRASSRLAKKEVRAAEEELRAAPEESRAADEEARAAEEEDRAVRGEVRVANKELFEEQKARMAELQQKRDALEAAGDAEAASDLYDAMIAEDAEWHDNYDEELAARLARRKGKKRHVAPPKTTKKATRDNKIRVAIEALREDPRLAKAIRAYHRIEGHFDKFHARMWLENVYLQPLSAEYPPSVVEAAIFNSAKPDVLFSDSDEDDEVVASFKHPRKAAADEYWASHSRMREQAAQDASSDLEEDVVVSSKISTKATATKRTASAKDVLGFAGRATRVTKPTKSPTAKKPPASEVRKPRGHPRIDLGRAAAASKVPVTNSPAKSTRTKDRMGSRVRFDREDNESKTASEEGPEISARTRSKSPVKGPVLRQPRTIAVAETENPMAKAPAKSLATNSALQGPPWRIASPETKSSRAESPVKNTAKCPAKTKATMNAAAKASQDASKETSEPEHSEIPTAKRVMRVTKAYPKRVGSKRSRRSSIASSTEEPAVKRPPMGDFPTGDEDYEDPADSDTMDTSGPASRTPRREMSNRQSASPEEQENKPLPAGQPSAPGRGTIRSNSNPEFLEFPDGTQKKNPFFETMPSKEIWHRNMPCFFPFGETPFMEKVMSEEISRDLAKGEEGDKSEEGLVSWAKIVFSGRPSAKKRPYSSPWELPEVNEEEVAEAVKEIQKLARERAKEGAAARSQGSKAQDRSAGTRPRTSARV